MSSTTLITFLLRAPSNVRTVELMGSWDNFTRPYPMEQDKRTGAGHWRGCHTFTDIICDGSSPSHSPGRTGGLKMGGTYWYYYRLDGDIEYYNEVEPVTSLCPLLPGQPVNILNVPVILPDTEGLHRRDNSFSSIKSEQRTMDPKDKYMNPRTPPKPRPAIPRLRTSPPLYQHSASSRSFLNLTNNNHENRSVSQPTSATHSPTGHQAPKIKIARSVSPPLTKGLRAAFLNIAGARSPSRDRGNHLRSRSTDHLRGTANLREVQTLRLQVSNPSSTHGSRVTSPMGSPTEDSGIGKLPFRRPLHERSENGPEAPSIHVRRASKSSRENTPLASLTLNGSAIEKSRTGMSSFSHIQRLDPLEEALSQQNTPMPMSTQERSTASDASTLTPPRLSEKRLPTLPNSPSSVMEEELRAIEALNRSLDMELLRSHFSDFTSVVGSELDVESPVEKSRFSEWSADTELVSPASMTSCSTLNADFPHYSFSEDAMASLASPEAVAASSGPTTPTLEAQTEVFSPTKVASDSPLLGSGEASSTTGGFSPGDFVFSPFSPLCIEDYEESDPKRYAGIFPAEVMTSMSIANGTTIASTHRTESRDAPKSEHSTRQHTTYMTESAAMKELMDEIGYLGDMISSGL